MSDPWAIWLAVCLLMAVHVRGLHFRGFLDAQETLNRVLGSMELALNFMDEEHERMNLDGVIGSRMVEGQLAVLLDRVPNDLHVADDTLQRLVAIQSHAGELSNKAMAFVARDQETYNNRIGAILKEGFWEHNYASRNTDPSQVVKPIVLGEAMHEDDSDDCVAELLGTGKNRQVCRVSRRCWKLMTAPGYRFYSLTHEVFYLQIGESFGCFTGSLLDYVDRLNEGFCSNMMTETAGIASAGCPENKRDLFMEQPALCGILGFRDFFRKDWLDQILSWQKMPRGCWGLNRVDVHSGRTKREERVLPDGCECHRTAVAVGALVQYLRYIIETMQ